MRPAFQHHARHAGLARAAASIAARAGLLVLAMVLAGSPADAQYFRRPVSHLDPTIMQIDEKAVLGARIEDGTRLVDHRGTTFRWGELTGKPLILVLAYYSCDGSCSIINQTLADLLKDVKAVSPGSDFGVLTLSFDRHDTPASTSAFRKLVADAGSVSDHWRFATFEREEDLRSQTERIGFKFFWSPEDRIFLHPGAFLFFSPEGRLVRVLYQQDIGARDIELAVLDAKQGQFRPSEIVNFALSLCYSYSYKDGKYRLSIPMIVGLGSLTLGLATLFGSIAIFKHSRRTKDLGEDTHAKAA